MSTPNVAIVIQGRLKSARLPNKLLADLNGKTALEQLYRRMKQVRLRGANTHVMVATPSDDAYKVFEYTGIMAVGGPEKDVLTRIMNAARQVEADYVVRITADNVLACPVMIAAMWEGHREGGLPLTQNWSPRTYPNGADLEIYDWKYLEYLDGELQGDDREWFASWAVEHLPVDGQIHFVVPHESLARYRITLDYEEDLALLKNIFTAMGSEIWGIDEVLSYLDTHPAVYRLNRMWANETGARPK